MKRQIIKELLADLDYEDKDVVELLTQRKIEKEVLGPKATKFDTVWFQFYSWNGMCTEHCTRNCCECNEIIREGVYHIHSIS